MTQTVKMAKVITMKVQISKDLLLNLVTTVDPIVTPEMTKKMYGIPGHVIHSEETSTMPLPFALNCAYHQRKLLGIED